MDVHMLLAERWHLESNRFAVEDITMGSQSSGTDVFSLLTRRSAFLGWITCIQPFSGGLSKLPMKLAGLKLSIRSSSQMLPNGLSFLHSLFLVWLRKWIPSITFSFFQLFSCFSISENCSYSKNSLRNDLFWLCKLVWHWNTLSWLTFCWLGLCTFRQLLSGFINVWWAHLSYCTNT